MEKKLKPFEGDWKEEILAKNKYKSELFEMYFTDSASIFRPIESDEEDPTFWATSRNTVVQNFNTEDKSSYVIVGGETIKINNKINKRTWKVTDSKRMIGNYQCRKAICEINDSTRIYAWFSIDVLQKIGPEGFNGLPGAILGLASEDGGVIYFTKSFEKIESKNNIFEPKIKTKNTYTFSEFKEKMVSAIDGSAEETKFWDEFFLWL